MLAHRTRNTQNAMRRGGRVALTFRSDHTARSAARAKRANSARVWLGRARNRAGADRGLLGVASYASDTTPQKACWKVGGVGAQAASRVARDSRHELSSQIGVSSKDSMYEHRARLAACKRGAAEAPIPPTFPREDLYA